MRFCGLALFLGLGWLGCGSSSNANGGAPPGDADVGAGGSDNGSGGNGGGTEAGGAGAKDGSVVPDSGNAGAGNHGGAADGGTDAISNDNDAETGGGADGGAGRWVLGYWAVWQATQYPLAHVQWQDMTHAALAFVLPHAPTSPTSDSPYATLDTSNVFANLGSTGMADFSSAAHSGGVKSLISLGGGGAGADFAAAASSANRAKFVSDVLAACEQWHYDGVDLDWEDSIDYSDFGSLITALRAAAPPGFLITIPIGSVNNNAGLDADAAALFGSSYDAVDQLNVMTYTGTGAYPGWAVWYFSPLLGQGSDHPFDVVSTMTAWNMAGIPKSKLGLGVGFYGRSVGPPVTAVLQSYGSAQVYQNDDTLSYGSILRNFYGKGGATYHWDSSAMAGYLVWSSPFQPSWASEFPNDTPPTVQFLTYEDPAGVAAKGDWAKSNGYGGVIIWTINEGIQFPDGSDGYANPLLDSVKQAFR